MSIKISKEVTCPNKTNLRSSKIEYLTIHFTMSTASPVGRAKQTALEFKNNDREASCDFVVDDGDTVYQCNPDLKNRYTWEVGGYKYNDCSRTGGGKFYNKATNQNCIGIEMCSSKTDKSKEAYTNDATDWYVTDKVWNNTIELAVKLMKEYDIPLSKVIRHADVTGKYCPSFMFLNKKYDHYNKKGSEIWEDFKKDLEKAYNGKATTSTTSTKKTTTSNKTSTSTTSKDVDVYYSVKASGKIYPEVKNNSDYAGVRGKEITDVAIRVTSGKIKYRVHVKGGKWLPWVTGCNWKDSNNGYAGNGQPIDAIQAVLDGKNEIVYRVSPVNKDYYSNQYDNNTDNGQDGYSGFLGKTIDRLQMRVKVK